MDWLRSTPVEGTVCCVVSAFCYHVGVFFGREAKDLESVTRVSKLEDLAKLWDAASKMLPLAVAVTGFVSSDTPIECQYSGLKGAVVETKEERHVLRRSYRGEWKRESTLPSAEWNEVPWYLDDGTSRLRILDARLASAESFASLPLAAAGEVFEKTMQSPIQEKLELDKGFKMLGIQKIERVLPIGTCLTVVGGVMKDETGSFVIQNTYPFPFYVSYRSVSEIIQDLQEASSVCMYTSAAFGLLGVILIAKHAFHYMKYKKMQKREAEYKRRLLDAAAAAKQASRRVHQSRAESEETD